MFYFLLAPLLAYNWILIFAAVIPAIVLMIYVFRSDRLEAENPSFLFRLALAGVLSTFIAMLIEWIAGAILDHSGAVGTSAYNVILYFIIVAYAEEGAKYFMLHRRTWNSPEFNCQYDAVVYAVFLSLGFALWENISYVMHYGFGTALVRAVTAIPGHACFGIFMGIFYGLAKGSSIAGDQAKTKLYRVLTLIVPAFIHGLYDYIASMQSGTGLFVVFIIILFIISFLLVRRMSINDKYFGRNRYY